VRQFLYDFYHQQMKVVNFACLSNFHVISSSPKKQCTSSQAEGFPKCPNSAVEDSKVAANCAAKIKLNFW